MPIQEMIFTAESAKGTEFFIQTHVFLSVLRALCGAYFFEEVDKNKKLCDELKSIPVSYKIQLEYKIY